MANRFIQQTFPSYVLPENLDLLMRAGAMKEQEAEQKVADFESTIQEIGKIPAYVPGDINYVKGKTKELMDDVYNMAHQNFLDPTVQSKLYDRIKDFTSDPNLSNVLAHNTHAKALVEDIQKNYKDPEKRGADYYRAMGELNSLMNDPESYKNQSLTSPYTQLGDKYNIEKWKDDRLNPLKETLVANGQLERIPNMVGKYRWAKGVDKNTILKTMMDAADADNTFQLGYYNERSYFDPESDNMVSFSYKDAKGNTINTKIPKWRKTMMDEFEDYATTHEHFDQSLTNDEIEQYLWKHQYGRNENEKELPTMFNVESFQPVGHTTKNSGFWEGILGRINPIFYGIGKDITTYGSNITAYTTDNPLITNYLSQKLSSELKNPSSVSIDGKIVKNDSDAMAELQGLFSKLILDSNSPESKKLERKFAINPMTGEAIIRVQDDNKIWHDVSYNLGDYETQSLTLPRVIGNTLKAVKELIASSQNATDVHTNLNKINNSPSFPAYDPINNSNSNFVIRYNNNAINTYKLQDGYDNLLKNLKPEDYTSDSKTGKITIKRNTNTEPLFTGTSDKTMVVEGNKSNNSYYIEDAPINFKDYIHGSVNRFTQDIFEQIKPGWRNVGLGLSEE